MRNFSDLTLDFPVLTEKELRSIKGGDEEDTGDYGGCGSCCSSSSSGGGGCAGGSGCFGPGIGGNDLGNVDVKSGGGGAGGGCGSGCSNAYGGGGGGCDTTPPSYGGGVPPTDPNDPSLLAPVTVHSTIKQQVWVTTGSGTNPYNSSGDTGYYEMQTVPADVKYEHINCMYAGGDDTKTKNIAEYKITGGQNTVYASYGSSIAVDNDGDPNCNTSIDPSYQSTTSYHYKDANGNTQYLDGTKVAYIALNIASFGKDANGNYNVHIGDVVEITNSSTGKSIYAVVGDGGNTGGIGEISYKAAKDLGFSDVSKTSASSNDKVNIFIFQGSRLKGNISRSDVDAAGAALDDNNPQLSKQTPPPNVSATCH